MHDTTRALPPGGTVTCQRRPPRTATPRSVWSYFSAAGFAGPGVTSRSFSSVTGSRSITSTVAGWPSAEVRSIVTSWSTAVVPPSNPALDSSARTLRATRSRSSTPNPSRMLPPRSTAAIDEVVDSAPSTNTSTGPASSGASNGFRSSASRYTSAPSRGTVRNRGFAGASADTSVTRCGRAFDGTSAVPSAS